MIVPGTTSVELTNNYKFLPTINPPNDPPEKPVIDNPKKYMLIQNMSFMLAVLIQIMIIYILK